MISRARRRAILHRGKWRMLLHRSPALIDDNGWRSTSEGPRGAVPWHWRCRGRQRRVLVGST
jgi:hypothetical protein